MKDYFMSELHFFHFNLINLTFNTIDTPLAAQKYYKFIAMHALVDEVAI